MSGASRKLLIADDEPWEVESLRGLVDWEGLSIELLPPAVNGEDALGKLETGRPDILITDINMPFVDGNEVIRIAKGRYPGLQAIVLSGYSDFSFVRGALLEGAVDYLLKPVTRNALVDVLDKALAALACGQDREREETDLREKLREASAILRDGEMSALISEEAPEASSGSAALDMDLEYASFTLVLAKLTAPAGRRGKGPGDIRRLAPDIKALLAKAAGGSACVAFRNVFARNEFVLVSDLDRETLAAALADLPSRLERRTALKASLAASRPCYSSDRLRAAYQEARAALMTRALGAGSAAVQGPEGRAPAARRRVTPELENRLAFALESRHKELAREVIFDQIGLRRCEAEGWLLLEARQTAEYVAGMIYHRVDPGPAASPRFMPALDNYSALLSMALDEEDIPEACSLLEQLLDEALGEPASPDASYSMLGVARRAQAYVDERYFEDLSLTAVAAAFRVDRAYLSRAFKQVTGCNIMLAIARKRIEKAQEYIRQRDLSLTDIADLVGYGEYAYFNRVFRKIAGMSPSEYKVAARRREA
jgi:AraC-like DNA-binding protein/FixJ family two-component response regulator